MIYFFIIGSVLLAMLVLAFILIADKKGRTGKKAGYDTSTNVKEEIKYLKWYNRLDNFFLTRSGFRKVRDKISLLSVYTSEEIKMYSVRFYLISLGSALGLIVSGIIIFRDLFSVMLVIVFSIVVKTCIIDKQVDNVHFELLKQMSHALSTVRQNYLRFDNLPDAINESEVGALLQRPFDDIYLILTGTEQEKRLEDFYQQMPFRLLQTFAGVCYLLNNSGDTKTPNGGSNFIEAISMMTEEVNLEIRRIVMQRNAFGILEYLPLAPLFSIGLVESFLVGTIPGTSIMLNGLYGYIVKILIIVSSIIGYTVITRINSVIPIRSNDRDAWVKNLLKNKMWKNFIKDIMPKKESKQHAKNILFAEALSLLTMEELYTKKVVFSMVGFVLSLFCCIISVNLSKEFIYQNVGSLSFMSSENLTAEDIDLRQRMDASYLKRGIKDKQVTPMEDTEARIFVESYIADLSPFELDEQVERIQKKYKAYYNTYFKWWMVLVCFGIAFLAWFIPEIMLLARAWLVKTESDEDVLQMQTLISILMNTQVDTLETIYWLARQSQIHKNVLLDCYHNYPSDPEFALAYLKDTSAIPEFVRIVDKLQLTISQISLKEAFGDLVAERSHAMRLREVTLQTTIKKKRTNVSLLSLLPLALLIVFYILTPLFILGFSEFKKALDMMKP